MGALLSHSSYLLDFHAHLRSLVEEKRAKFESARNKLSGGLARLEGCRVQVLAMQVR